jgi:hypothetical protein
MSSLADQVDMMRKVLLRWSPGERLRGSTKSYAMIW